MKGPQLPVQMRKVLEKTRETSEVDPKFQEMKVVTVTKEDKEQGKAR